MNPPSRISPCILILAVAVSSLWTRQAVAQEAQIVEQVAKEIAEGLGKDTVEFGGDEVVQETAERLVSEAAGALGESSAQIVKMQVERVVATADEAAIFDLKLIPGDQLPLLAKVSDGDISSAVVTMARPGVVDGLESLGTMTLKQEALAAEMRLPGAGLKLVENFGEEGADIVPNLTEDQANSLLSGTRPHVLGGLPKQERFELLNAVCSRPDARVFNWEKPTGPLIVVAGGVVGVVIWHAEDLMLSPDVRVTEMPDGTVIQEKTSIGSRVIQALPQVGSAMSRTFVVLGIWAIAALSVALMANIWLRHRRSKAALLHKIEA
jgi:hypothetical protein